MTFLSHPEVQVVVAEERHQRIINTQYSERFKEMTNLPPELTDPQKDMLSLEFKRAQPGFIPVPSNGPLHAMSQAEAFDLFDTQ